MILGSSPLGTDDMSLDLAAELARYGPAGSAARPSLDESRAYCLRLTRTHYENFTVGSRLIPAELRQHMANVYAYCRWADDLADEGGNSVDGDSKDGLRGPQHSRLELLDWWQCQLEQCLGGPNYHPVFVALQDTLRSFDLPLAPFRDLLIAFRRDQFQNRYETWADLYDYARYSANPVGRIVLGLWRAVEPANVELSDHVCTGLQLANFCQDVARDARAGRIYIPRETYARCGCVEADFFAARATEPLRRALAESVERAETALRDGAPLIDRVPRRLSIDIELFVLGGRAILHAIRREGYDVWTRRPTVGRWRKCQLGLRAFLRFACHGPNAK